MKKFLSLFACALLLCAITVLPGCAGTPRLEKGGAYAPVGEDGQTFIAPDVGFAIAEMGFKVTHLAIKLAFDLEFNNRVVFWNISPEIKKTLDKLRPVVNQAIIEYDLARTAYMANPTPAGLSTLQTVLSKLKQLSLTAEAVIPKGA
jgi:hypothetical protein